METRKIYVVDTRREKSIIMTGAETLGELKTALTENGIEYDGMTFFEGYSAVELKDDSSQLPTNVKKRNGETTNELLIMITNSSKKIKSGATPKQVGSDRAGMFRYIKEHNLAKEIREHFGRPYTQVSTAELISFVKELKYSENSCAYAEDLRTALIQLTNLLVEKDIISRTEATEAMRSVKCEWEEHNDFPSDEEINEMFAKFE